jgi:ribosomal protein RSM22 (predicted rRNA methylase)
MELPSELRRAVDAALAGHSSTELARAAELLSGRYRAEIQDGKMHLAEDLAVKAYLAVRLPATFAAVRAAMQSVGDLRPQWSPSSLLDVGSGPGTAIWAAESRWTTLRAVTAVEGSAAARIVGSQLRGAGTAGPLGRAEDSGANAVGTSAPSGRAQPRWLDLDLNGGLPGVAAHDLVTAAYVLNELTAGQQLALVDRLWALTADTLLIVEPGTPAGWRRILAARGALIGAGAHLIAPCPHAHACPLVAPDWCHFARRVARTRIHQAVKGGELAWEDEKYLYLAVSRAAAASPPYARVLVPPRQASGRAYLKLCTPEGAAVERLVSRREGAVYKSARRSEWGDSFPQ